MHVTYNAACISCRCAFIIERVIAQIPERDIIPEDCVTRDRL